MTAVKIIKLLGISSESWDDAVYEAVNEATNTIDDIHGVEGESPTATAEDGPIDG